MLQSTAEIYDEVSSELDETITTDDLNEDKTVAGKKIIKLIFYIKNLTLSNRKNFKQYHTVNFITLI